MKEYTLVTGGAGFLGSALVPRLQARGKNVIVLSHKKSALFPKEVMVVEGDILKLNLGIKEEGMRYYSVSEVYHLAAIHRLGESNPEEIWETNVGGTANVIDFCEKHQVPHLFFVSTAYTQGRNPYERSKGICEWMVSHLPKVTVFKPSIIMGIPQHFYPGTVSQFISLLIRLHQRGEVARRKIEGSLHLPVIKPVFRLRANPLGKLNLISIDDVADAMAEIDQPGTFWLTHLYPPTIAELAEWVGELIMVDIKIEPSFQPTPLETLFERMSKAFTPYLYGDNFPSDLKEGMEPITKEFIRQTIRMTLLG